MRQRRLQSFVDDALMCGVLIDDDKTVARLRHNVSFVHLRARRPQRVIEAVSGRIRERAVARRLRSTPPAMTWRLRSAGRRRQTKLACGLRNPSRPAMTDAPQRNPAAAATRRGRRHRRSSRRSFLRAQARS